MHFFATLVKEQVPPRIQTCEVIFMLQWSLNEIRGFFVILSIQTTCWFHLGQTPMVYTNDENSSNTIYKSEVIGRCLYAFLILIKQISIKLCFPNVCISTIAKIVKSKTFVDKETLEYYINNLVSQENSIDVRLESQDLHPYKVS